MFTKLKLIISFFNKKKIKAWLKVKIKVNVKLLNLKI
jgi:hypothetical protein